MIDLRHPPRPDDMSEQEYIYWLIDGCPQYVPADLAETIADWKYDERE